MTLPAFEFGIFDSFDQGDSTPGQVIAAAWTSPSRRSGPASRTTT